MKKFIVLCSMIVALGFVVTGCGGNDKPADTKKTETTAPEQTPATPGAEEPGASS